VRIPFTACIPPVRWRLFYLIPLLTLVVAGCSTGASPTVVAVPPSGGPPIVDRAGNLTGDTTRKFMDILETTIRAEGDYYVLDVVTASPFPTAADMAQGKRFDFMWFVDIDRDRRTGQSPLGNDYNIHLFLTESGWDTAWFKVSPVAEKDGIAVQRDEFRIRVAGARANLIFPRRYLPRTAFELWALCNNRNAPSWPPVTENPATARASFAF
jgi:hypothetical protein